MSEYIFLKYNIRPNKLKEKRTPAIQYITKQNDWGDYIDGAVRFYLI